MTTPRERPLFLVRGGATDEEVAAVLVVLQGLAAAAAGAEAAAPPGTPRSVWASPARRLREMPRPGAGAWRASALPR